MTRSPDATEQRMHAVQQQQRVQHAEMVNMIRELRKEQQQIQKQLEELRSQQSGQTSKENKSKAEVPKREKTEEGPPKVTWKEEDTPQCSRKDEDSDTSNEEYSKVVRRQWRKKPAPEPSKATNEVSRPKKRRQAALIIDPGTKSIQETVAHIKSGTNPETIHNNITRIRATKGGKILVRIRGDKETTNIIAKDVIKAAGASARLASRNVAMEIRDIDEWTTKEDIEEALVLDKELEDKPRVISLRNVTGGTQTALVLFTEHNAEA